MLVEAAVSVGLDGIEARQVLQRDDYADAVRQAERHYQTMGVHSVPSIILGGQYLLTGAQPVEAFERAIHQVLEAA